MPNRDIMARAFMPSRHFIFAGIALLGVVAGAWADSAYLQCLGPAPLRFRATPPPPTNVFILPKPTPEPLEPPPVSTKPEKPAAAPVAITNAPLPEPPPAIRQTNAFVPPPPQNDVVSPQMLLKYFNKGTNGASSSVIMPLDFTPPKDTTPPAPASSKAEYSTTP